VEVCVKQAKQSKKGGMMKAILDWILFAGMTIGAIVAAAWDWLPGVYSHIVSMSMTTDIGGFDWGIAGGVIFLGLALIAYFYTGRAAGNVEETAIDYSVPRFVKVRVIE